LTIINGHVINEISLDDVNMWVLHCRVSSETQFETWWWPSARVETSCLSNKYSTTLLIVFWLHYLHHLMQFHLDNSYSKS